MILERSVHVIVLPRHWRVTAAGQWSGTMLSFLAIDVHRMWESTPGGSTGTYSSCLLIVRVYCRIILWTVLDSWTNDDKPLRNFSALPSHRIVFYYSEIATTKRRYIRGDRGIKAMMIPPRFGLLIQEQSSLLARIRTLDPAGTSPPVIAEAALFCMGEEADAQCSPQEETRVLKQRLWRLNQEMRMICTFLLDQYHSGARMIVPGEPLSWADLVDSGERPRPLSSNAALDEPPVAR